MKIYKYPKREVWDEIVTRPRLDLTKLNETVGRVLADVRQRGDAAVKDYEQQFDHAKLDSLAVTAEEMDEAERLVSNNLREVEVVMKSEALLIGNKNMSKDKRATLEEMLFRFKAVKDAEDKKYVRMNAPKAHLEEIINVLPGLKSPTIIPLADEDWCSVHTVLDQKRFWEIIGKLKEMGAQGILVTPIEKMIL